MALEQSSAQNTQGNDASCLGCFREDSTKSLLLELHLEGSTDCDLIEMKKGVSIRGNDTSKARSTWV